MSSNRFLMISIMPGSPGRGSAMSVTFGGGGEKSSSLCRRRRHVGRGGAAASPAVASSAPSIVADGRGRNTMTEQ